MNLVRYIQERNDYSLQIKQFKWKSIYHTVMPLVGGQGGLLAHLEFVSSVNPIPTRGARLAHHITDCPPGFENLTASLLYNPI